MEFFGDFLGTAYRCILYILKRKRYSNGSRQPVITMEDAYRAGLGEIFDRVVVELVGKMEEMKMVSFFADLKFMYS